MADGGRLIRGVIATIFHRVLYLGCKIVCNSRRPSARRWMLSKVLAGKADEPRVCFLRKRRQFFVVKAGMKVGQCNGVKLGQ